MRDTAFVPGFIIISRGRVSLEEVWSGVLSDDVGEKERSVDFSALLRISCCLLKTYRVRGIPIANIVSNPRRANRFLCMAGFCFFI